MTYRHVSVVAILIAVAAVTVSAQILGGDPMTTAALSLKNMITTALRVLAILAFIVFGFKFFTGRGDVSDVVGMVIGGAFVFGADRVAAMLFPGLTP